MPKLWGWLVSEPPPPSPEPTSTKLSFFLDPTVEQLILVLYEQVTSSAGHFFVEVLCVLCISACLTTGLRVIIPLVA